MEGTRLCGKTGILSLISFSEYLSERGEMTKRTKS